MIRPVTLVCWVLALCAGLYLYRAKHDVELMDQRIDQIARQTADLRSQTRRFLDDWIARADRKPFAEVVSER